MADIVSAAFTPGPWQALSPDAVGEVAISYRHGSHDLICAHVYDGPEFGSAQANARLIAAAPDLLAALQAIIDHWDAGNFSRERALWNPACAAIKKARGQS